MSLLSKVSQSQKPRYFRKLWMHAIEWTLVVEFVEGFYTFSLWLELLLVPFYFLFGAVYVFSKYQKNGVPVRKLAGVVLNGIAVAVFMISFYQTIVHCREAFDEEHIKDIFLAPVMTLLYTPFLYLTALFNGYEQLFLQLRFSLPKDSPDFAPTKRTLFHICHINLVRLNLARSFIGRFDFYEPDQLPGYLCSIKSRKLDATQANPDSSPNTA